MKISVEISYYPLKDEYIPPIKGFIERIKNNSNLKVVTNSMSTQIFGDYDEVFMTLKKEIKTSFQLPHSVFVIKIINSELSV